MADEIVSPIRRGAHDIALERDRVRRRRVYRAAAVVIALETWVVVNALLGRPILPAMPTIDPLVLVPVLFFVALLVLLVGTQMGSARSPHVVYRPEQVDVRLDDVIGIDPVKEDVRRSIDLFQTHKQFADQMGGTPRRGLLFEGLPGTGKTMTAKAMAAEAGVPFLFVSATSFQSMYYGATAKKIRAYFKALRKAARTEGGAIGFIEEIDAIATRRGGMASAAVAASPFDAFRVPQVVTNAVVSEGTGGVVNELLVQMQSFDEPTPSDKLVNWFIARTNLLLPATRQLKQRRPVKAPILLIAATNRADSLDPALLRPGRFDRRLTFATPDAVGRRALVDHFLARRSTDSELDDPALRDRLAAATNGWTPVMIEHLLDEALVNALRRGSMAMTYADVEHARITEMVGIGQPVRYTDAEQRLIATHEAGHAVTAWLAAPNRTLEVLTIIRRGDALGLLAHGDCEEVWTHSHYDLRALVQIAMGGWVAEELFFGQTSTGPAGDLASATRTAAQMVGAAGMTGSLISFAATPHDLVSAVLSDAPARAQLEAVLDDARSTVRRLLSRHRHLVEALRDALLERHELIGPEITAVLEEATLAQQQLLEREEHEKSAAVAAGAAAAGAAAAERLRVA
ncbi:AAA family ATPase [Cellulomonas fengjieae]|uniref:AAA family ATPase n=1 Tax=Cellulomonas fengjieae TaxID=2819978 RepID=A0ABS3SBE7_9CELL|nr:AAA family ATPase [Cellulomonas fengjieae]MBO3083083.1 AAA family ATPase [Cellulomonas fengjieae]MBO3102170.1 AAA family ATPase [Cellulomonas fengjieae]QVI65550.1 AAA family ATPase [Cellulomonas fengjieae]